MIRRSLWCLLVLALCLAACSSPTNEETQPVADAINPTQAPPTATSPPPATLPPPVISVDGEEGQPAASADSAPVASSMSMAAAGNSYLTYIQSGDIWIVPLNVDDTGVQIAADPQAITSVGHIERLHISPDGQKIAFAQHDGLDALLSTVALDGSPPVVIANLGDVEPVINDDGFTLTRDFGGIEWHPAGTSLYFNEILYDDFGDLTIAEDLWQAGLDGTLTEIHPRGEGGGLFQIQGDKVIMSTPTEIVRSNLDGSGREAVATFESILSYSKYPIYPDASWQEDQNARVVISSVDPRADDASGSLWTIPASGPAEQIGQIANNNFAAAPVTWSPNGRNLATIMITSDGQGGHTEAVAIAEGNGANLQLLTESISRARPLGWSPDDSALIYVAQAAVGDTKLFLHPVSGESIQLNVPTDYTPLGARWVTPQHFVIPTSGPTGELILFSGDSAGQVAQIGSIAAAGFINLDGWSP